MAKFLDPDYPEKFCHFTGEATNYLPENKIDGTTRHISNARDYGLPKAVLLL